MVRDAPRPGRGTMHPVTSPLPRSLYVHVPFCAHRCGYCDFVTTSRSPELHERYVAALRRELELRSPETAGPGSFDTIFIGGGTPTLLEPAALESLLAWTGELAAPGAEVTIECNPETVDAALARRLVDGGVQRVSLGAQSFTPAVLDVLERRATPDTVRGAVAELRAAGVQRLSLDLIWGVPGQTVADVSRDVAEALALGPDHISAYELEFKPGTRLTRAFGGAEAAVTNLGESSDEFYDLVIDQLQAAGWWWYETANFARTPDERCRHNLAYWQADPWVGVGVGAVETRVVVTAPAEATGGALLRRTNLPNVPRWLAAVEAGELPPSREETIDERISRTERVMLGVRLDAPVRISAADLLDGIVDGSGLERVVDLELGSIAMVASEDGVFRGDLDLRLTRRGRMLQGSVGALLLDP
jgi:putative oxygen-independent coproporphyrinogen III oxidase